MKRLMILTVVICLSLATGTSFAQKDKDKKLPIGCTDGQLPKWQEETDPVTGEVVGTWVCADDIDTTTDTTELQAQADDNTARIMDLESANPNPDPPCFDNWNRYVDCGNGTVTDTVTGLIWLKDANCFGQLDWAAANNAAAQLKHGDCNLGDNSKPGDWRLPTKGDWDATLLLAQWFQCENPSMTDTSGRYCDDGGDSAFTGVQSYHYWSSTTLGYTSVDLYNGAYCANLYSGFTDGHLWRDWSLYVWPVRDP